MKPLFIKQQGFLSVVAVLLILVVGFIGLAVAQMYFSSAFSTANFSQSATAFYLAEAGLEEGTRFLLAPNLSGAATRVACGSLSGNSNLTSVSLGKGTYTTTTTGTAPTYKSSTLSSSITSSATTVAVTSAASFATSGRILIDREIINYAAISGNSFIGLTRGADLSLASSHTSGTYVSQFQCNLDAKGGIPNLSSPLDQRELQQGVELQEAWAVAANNGNNFALTHWNYPTELAWNNGSYKDTTNVAILYGVGLSSNAEGWAAGAAVGTKFTLVHLQGTTWTATPLSGACSGQDLYRAVTVSSQEAWAVGVAYQTTACLIGPYSYTILRWNGSAWTKLTPTSSPSIPAYNANNQTLYGISVIDSNGNGTADFGFAVGNNGVILKYNGSTWTAVSSPTTELLTGVSVVSASEAWAVGYGGVILKWNGTSWSNFTSPTTLPLLDVNMLDSNGNGTADTGIAVGNNGAAIIYNGSSWTLQSEGSDSLYSSAIYSANDIWIGGNAGVLKHWNGSAWTSVTSNLTTTIYGISAIQPKTYPLSAWKEVFP